MKPPQWLLEHCANKFSQTGEDGVIAKILALLPATDRWCVEFGAWDGIHLSNVRNLILEQGYRAVMIEGDKHKFEFLKRNYADRPGVHPVNKFVGFDAATGLDAVLAATAIPKDFDFLSIDVDGTDYQVWEAVDAYRPKVVCVEFNPTIPTEVDFVQPSDARVQQGNSLLALDRLARAKGYELVCVLPWNAFFVDRKYFAAFEIADNRPQAMRPDQSAVTWIFCGYDGSVHLAGAKTVLWHEVALDERKMQALPRMLQAFPDSYTPLQRRLFRFLKRIGALKAGPG